MALEHPRRSVWIMIAWFGLLLVVCYAPVMRRLVAQWDSDPDVGHGFFVPPVAAFIVWQRREELLAIKSRPCWWGLVLVICGGGLLIAATMGVELFVTRVAMVMTLTGMVWLLGGTAILRKVMFPLFLLLFMIPIPQVAYNRITFPLQLLASRLAGNALSILGIPVLREGNILELASQKLSVVEACSGIRSLLSLTFVSLVYGYFFEEKRWIRVLLFLATIPIAIVANASRVTFTGIASEINPKLAEGIFHESTGWVIFMVALVILIGVHQAIRAVLRWLPTNQRKVTA